MGSGGRGESYLFPDQDNGFILDDYPDLEHARIDAFFIELAARMTGQLDQLGPARGGVMAINPVWRKSVSQWRWQIGLWVRRRGEVAMQLADVLFDFQSVFGERRLADEVWRHILELCGQSGFPACDVRRAGRAPRGPRLVSPAADRGADPAHKGQINLKYAGTLPLAEAIRLLALRGGIAATGTLARIDALGSAGELSRDVQDYLRAAFDHITGLQLRPQIADFQAGRPISNFVDPADLTAREIELLKDSFAAINALRDRVRAELTGEVL